MIPKILIGCPVSQKKEYCLFDWIDHVRQLTYPNLDIILVDNSHNPAFYLKVLEKGVKCVHVKPEGIAVDYITKSANLVRAYALQNDFDYFMSIECDNFPPLDVVELLLSFGKDNISLPYFLNHKNKEAHRLGVQSVIDVRDGRATADVLPPLFDNMEFDGECKPYIAPSLGCTLISRDLLKQVRFEFDPNRPSVFHDSFFHLRSRDAGFQPYALMSDICEHRRGSWKYNVDIN